MPSLVRINVRRLVTIVETIDRAALVPVQPGAVTAERDQIGERNVGVVPHESRLISPRAVNNQVAIVLDHPVATARGTDLTDPDATESVPRAVATGSSIRSERSSQYRER